MTRVCSSWSLSSAMSGSGSATVVAADTRGMKLRDDRGLKGVELSGVLVLLGALVLLAMPLFTRIGDQVAVLSDAVEARSQTFEDVGVDEPVVAGIQLTQSADGAECRWLTADDGTVYGTWRIGDETLSGRFSEVPAECPTAVEVSANGFGR